MAKKRYLRFGGPGLSAHQSTWYDDLGQPVGSDFMRVFRVAPGHLVECDRVKDAYHYVLREQASVVETDDGAPESDTPAAESAD